MNIIGTSVKKLAYRLRTDTTFKEISKSPVLNNLLVNCAYQIVKGRKGTYINIRIYINI